MLEAAIAESGAPMDSLGDICVGNVQLGGAYAGPARMAQFVAGIPETVPLSSVNRQCSSGLQAVATIANSIKAGQIVGGIGAGVESMTHGGGVADPNQAPPPIDIGEIIANKLAKDSLTPMGVTSENVAERYGISRQQQDALAVRSHAMAIQATESGHFAKEIVPITVTVEVDDEDEEITVTKDDGPRPGTTMEKLAGLRAVFKEGGSTTAGNASQVSDGAAAVVLMRRSKAVELGLPIIGAYRGYQVVGVMPDEMGIGPAVAIPAVLQECGLTIDDIDVYEINEAFASQAAYCVQKLGIPMEKVNPNGGAIALGKKLCLYPILHLSICPFCASVYNPLSDSLPKMFFNVLLFFFRSSPWMHWCPTGSNSFQRASRQEEKTRRDFDVHWYWDGCRSCL